MLDSFVIKRVLSALVLPPTSPLLVAIAGLLLLQRRPRLGRGLVWFGVGTLFLLSLPVVANGLSWLLYHGGPIDLDRAKQAQAVVILGGGLRHQTPEYGGDTLGRLTLDRVRYGARVARLTGLPVLVTGGSTAGSATEADVMANALEDEFGVRVQWRETDSRNTRENARFSATILKHAGVERVLLVSHGFDVPRAKAEFEAAGLGVIPAPTHVSEFSIDDPREFWPSVGALYGSYYACYELLAGLARTLGM
jgi:uncharacterized SAM-binding protein YcdF (DUF218 family)